MATMSAMSAMSLDLRALYEVLTQAASNNPQQAVLQLQSWEKQPGYFSSLQTLFMDKGLPFELRYLAAIQLKNGIDKYWRKTAAHAITKDEKALIRSRCMEAGIDEPDHRLALQSAVFIAKIVRLEFPHDWPYALTTITQRLREAAQQGSPPIQLPRTLLIILYIVKELSTAKLLRARKSLYGAAPEVCQVLGQIYVDGVNRWRQAVPAVDSNVAQHDAIDNSLLTLRALRRLIVAGFEFPNRHEEVHDLWNILGSHFDLMLTMVKQHGHSLSIFRTRIEKHLIQISKLHLDMVKTHPAAFSQLPNAIGIVRAYWGLLIGFGQSFGSQTHLPPPTIGTDGDAEEQIPYDEKLSLKGLLILRACVKMVYSPTVTFRYQTTEDKEERKRSTDSMKTGLLSEALIREMMETLVTRFFVFRPQDLRQWEEEPDEWERREEGQGEAWEFSVRICAEKLFLDLVINNKDLLVPPLLNVFYTVATPENGNVMLKDSIYAAIGLAAPVLEKHLDFNAFLGSTLVSEVQIRHPGYNILRRRIAIVLGQWMPVKELNPSLVYQVFQFLLDKDDSFNDLVVRVTAGRQLQNVIDPYELPIDQFNPYAGTILSRVMGLVQEVELPETKLALLGTINNIVVRMEHHITPLADQIISFLPPLWDQAGDEYLMKQTILAILSALVTSMKDASLRFHSLILPLISSSIDVASKTRVYLLEEAMDLWSAILAQTPFPPSADLLALTDNLFPLFDTADENFRKALELTESYVLLAPQFVLENSHRFASAFTALLAAGLKRQAVSMITNLVELLIQVASSLGGGDAVQQLSEILVGAGLLPRLLAGLKSAHEAHQTARSPNRPTTDVDGLVETDYFTVLARIMYSTPQQSAALLSTSVPVSPFETTLSWLLTECFSHFENIGNPDRKKLVCLGLTALLEERRFQNAMLGRLQELMGVWTDVIAECVVDGKDTLVWHDLASLKPEGPEAPQDARKRELEFSDPVHRTDVRSYVQEHLRATIEAAGGPEAFQRNWLVNVDQDVVRSFAALGVLS